MACKERGRLEPSGFLILIQSRDHDPSSGTTTEGREALRTVLDFLHPGDVLTGPGSTASLAASVTCRTSCGRCGRGARA
jgi:hypothetical protein